MTGIAAATLHDVLARLIRAGGSERAEAEAVAAHLVEANLVGHDSHGAIRAPKYLAWVAAGELLANRQATLAVDAGPLVVVDGGFGYGQVIGAEAMALAIGRARTHGLALVGIRNSGHLGRIGAWAEMLAEAGLVSVHFVNTSGYGILVAPHGATERRLSANPIAAGAPGPDGPIVLDIATSATAEGKIQVARNKGETLPPGVVLDGAGRPITDPEAFYRDPPGAILPFGGHKGSGLSVFCEILAGSLTGGGSSHAASPTAWRLVNNMLTLAIDPSRLGGAHDVGADIARLTDWVRSARPAVPGEPPLLPGEIERRTRTERLRNGIPLDRETMRQLAEAAAAHRVTLPFPLAEIA
ncbi:malate/lactate/ureidoglycolate dehydrogenase [Elioraea sp.]|uniref:malate/lactate/ureidoglycolate dehydrogenase n=1 Tax=Elioraea sp. TaxID=2185103 RepID=UPI003F70A2AB